jgi:sigma-B regulation protein RsbU (phosphoserine phosphatase)
LNISQQRIIYSSAAHPPPLLLHRDGALELLDQGGTIIGLNGVVPFQQEERQLQPGDKVILYTDGVVEYQNREEEPFGPKRLYDLARNLYKQPISEILDGIYEGLMDFGRHAKTQDDISLLGFEFNK